MAETGNALTDEIKKSILLKNIQDPWYEPWIATCNRLDYDETLNELRAAALRNGKYDKPRNRTDRRNMNFTKNYDNEDRKPDGMYFPPEVRNRMSPEARKIIIEYRKKLQNDDDKDKIYKKQYDKEPEEQKTPMESNNDMRKQNVITTEKQVDTPSSKEQDQTEKEERPYASLFKRSVIAPRRANIMKTVKPVTMRQIVPVSTSEYLNDMPTDMDTSEDEGSLFPMKNRMISPKSLHGSRGVVKWRHEF